jgi:hypothetical protein
VRDTWCCGSMSSVFEARVLDNPDYRDRAVAGWYGGLLRAGSKGMTEFTLCPLQAKPGTQKEVGVTSVNDEAGTISWFAEGSDPFAKMQRYTSSQFSRTSFQNSGPPGHCTVVYARNVVRRYEILAAVFW